MQQLSTFITPSQKHLNAAKDLLNAAWGECLTAETPEARRAADGIATAYTQVSHALDAARRDEARIPAPDGINDEAERESLKSLDQEVL